MDSSWLTMTRFFTPLPSPLLWGEGIQYFHTKITFTDVLCKSFTDFLSHSRMRITLPTSSACLSLFIAVATVGITPVSAALPANFRPVYDTSSAGQYTDTSRLDLSSRIAISALTRAGVVQGDPSGTFRANDGLNRAEFMQIVARLLPSTQSQVNLRCFPDVPSGAWYEWPVCLAKSLGIVRGNVDVRVVPANWKFEPNRFVQYEEAVKVLVKLNAFSVDETNDMRWYVPFINAANQRNLELPGLVAGDPISRGEMSRLILNFLAYSDGTLQNLRNAEMGIANSSSSSSRSSSSSSSSMSSSSRSSVGGVFDPFLDRTAKSNILLLDSTSTILAGAKYFSNNEPIDVTSITVTLENPVASIDVLFVYDQDGRVLGTATKRANGSYMTTLPAGSLQLEKRVDHSIYVRARLMSSDQGGVSGETVQIAMIDLNGNGSWSNNDYIVSSNETFLVSNTARGAITSITNVGGSSNLLTQGTNQILGTFRFATQAKDSLAQIRLTQLRMQINATSGVVLSNVYLRQDSSDTTSPCSISSAVITCSSIPSSLGTISDSEDFRVYGDITVTGDPLNPRLSISINTPGTPASSGDITWTDGESTFTWLPLNTPVVRGVQFQ